MRKLELEEIPNWIYDHMKNKENFQIDFNRVISLLQKSVKNLSQEIDKSSKRLPNLFKTIIGNQLEYIKDGKLIKEIASYLLINQIAFYQVLSKNNSDLPALKIEKINNLTDLHGYFSKVLEINYSPIFEPNIVSKLPDESVDTVKKIIKIIKTLKLEYINQDILGKVFHNLIPISIRKRAGVYYTLNKASNLLANLSINDSEAKIFDPTCGSGTLLVSSYNRKKDLLLDKKNKFNKNDHERFLEEGILGVDIMPFAAQLSCINLALQAPLYRTETVNVGVEDSTKLNPSDKIEILGGKTFSESEEIELEKADVVIMNPPFTRQETVADISKNYKKKLEERFSDVGAKGILNRKMSYYSYFLFLADKFLGRGGKIAAVLPASLLRKGTERDLRKILFKNYNIEYIIVREDRPNFSENTDLREILVILEKGRIKKNETSFVILNDLDKVDSSKIEEARLSNQRIIKKSNFKMRKINQGKLNMDNFFRFISTSDHDLLEKWRSFKKSELVCSCKDLEIKTGMKIKRGIESNKGASIQAMSLNSQEAYHLKRKDIWLTEDLWREKIVTKHRKSGEEIAIPKNSVSYSLRRTAGVDEIDITNRKEFVLHSHFPRIEKFLRLGTDRKEINVSFLKAWDDYVRSRLSNLSLIRRLDISGEGSSLLSFFSRKPRAWPGTAWSILGLNDKVAKLTSIWFNSSINLLQLLIERMPTRGPWMQFHKYIIEDLKFLDPTKLSQEDTDGILNLFDEISSESFPAIWKQLAMNSKRENFSENEIKELNKAFDNIESFLGKKFTPRIKIDKTILSAMNIERGKKVLEKLYPKLLKEIAVLKKIIRNI